MLETESDTAVVSELQQQSWAYSESVFYALGSHGRSQELDPMILTGLFQLVVYEPGIIKKFTSFQTLIEEDCFEAWWIFKFNWVLFHTLD